MQNVIYVDILIFINVTVTFLILMTTADFIHIHVTKLRYVAGAVTGGLFSLLILAPALNIFTLFLVRLLMCVIIVMITFGRQKPRIILKCLFGFCMVNFLYAGITYFIYSVFTPEGTVYNNGYLHFRISTISLIIITVAVFLCLKVADKFILKTKKGDLVFDVELFNDGKNVLIKALYDSGNNVRDIYTGKPVIIANITAVKDLFGEEFTESLLRIVSENELDYVPKGIRLLPVKTLGSGRMLPAVSVEKAVVKNNGFSSVCIKPCLAFTKDTFDNKEYDALINEAVTGGVIL